MESLISIDFRDYNSTESPLNCLNELSLDEFQDLDKFSEVDKFSEMLTTKYADKTFCIQTDYDYQFGNVTWERVYFYFADAEDAIIKDWDSREGQPHWTIDKSYISVYSFSELNNADAMKKQKIVEELHRHLI